jgi:hypothetical protein
LQIPALNVSTPREINAAFESLARERPDALFVGGDGFFSVTLFDPCGVCRPPYGWSRWADELWKRHRGCLTSGRRLSGRILKGAKPLSIDPVADERLVRITAWVGATHVNGGTAISMRRAASVTHQSANLDKLTQIIDREDRVARCHRYKSSPLVVEEPATTNQQRARACLDDGRKRRIEWHGQQYGRGGR